MRDGEPAIFSTLAEAQRAADAHERQGYPNGGTFDDGLWWPAQEWWLDQEAVAERDRHVVRRG